MKKTYFILSLAFLFLANDCIFNIQPKLKSNPLWASESPQTPQQPQSGSTISPESAAKLAALRTSLEKVPRYTTDFDLNSARTLEFGPGDQLKTCFYEINPPLSTSYSGAPPNLSRDYPTLPVLNAVPPGTKYILAASGCFMGTYELLPGYTEAERKANIPAKIQRNPHFNPIYQGGAIIIAKSPVTVVLTELDVSNTEQVLFDVNGDWNITFINNGYPPESLTYTPIP